MTNWIQQNWPYLGIIVILGLSILEIQCYRKYSKSFFGIVLFRIRVRFGKLVRDALLVIGVLFLVFIFTCAFSPSVEEYFKSYIGYSGNFSENFLFNFIAASATVLALSNTIQILKQVTSDIHNFEHLLDSVKDELDKIAHRPDKINMIRKPYFYMYVKTPAFGHISGENSADNDSISLVSNC